MVSVSVPIWLTLTRIELAMPSAIPRASPLPAGEEEFTALRLLQPKCYLISDRGRMKMEQSADIAVPAPLSAAPRRRFIAYHKWDRNFFLVFLALCWLGVLMGFAPAVELRRTGHADYPAPLVLQIHAVAFSGWMILLTTQILLIRARRPLIHMRLGMISVALIPLMTVTAFLSEVYSQNFRFREPDEKAFFAIAIYYVIAFPILATLAIVARKNPAGHKRLILLATTIIVGAAYGRWWGGPLYRLVGDGLFGTLIYTFAAADLLMLGAVAYDWWTRGRPHRVYEIAVPAILLGQIATTVVYHSPRWQPIARFIVGR